MVSMETNIRVRKREREREKEREANLAFTFCVPSDGAVNGGEAMLRAVHKVRDDLYCSP